MKSLWSFSGKEKSEKVCRKLPHVEALSAVRAFMLTVVMKAKQRIFTEWEKPEFIRTKNEANFTMSI